MNKRVFIIHRWSGSPSTDWYPWLKKELEAKGIEAHTPATPHPDEPTIADAIEHLSEVAGEPDENTYFVGHSIGCQIILRYLETLDTPVGGVVLVAPWFNLMNLEDKETEELARPWVETPMNFKKLKKIIPALEAFFSSNDPYVPRGDEQLFKENLNAQTKVIENAGHFTEDGGYKEFPLVRDAILEMTGD